MLILDKKEGHLDDVKRFRMMADPLAPLIKKNNQTALTILPISGSGQLTLVEIHDLKKRLGSQKEIYVVDLREESHFFLNGQPVSWFEGGNDANRGLSVQQIQFKEKELAEKVKNSSEVELTKICGTKLNPVPQTSLVKVESVILESDLCMELGMNYVRLPITDRRRPSDATVDQFLKFLKTLKEGHWLHFHCKGGAGRTTSLMAMLDMLSHSNRHDLPEIVKRQHALGGRDLFELPLQDAWNYSHAVERSAFLQKFYKYCHASNQGILKSWSEWVATQSVDT
ncbi:MAG: hypothetical protein JHC93_07890 [Parachlamydiales bacterium]|nr:hypothetical protein [Parachlamydiales bacterium]